MKRGFTIIELLVAITIIGILISAASLAFGRARSTSRDARRMSDVLLIGKAVDSAAANSGGQYPGKQSNFPPSSGVNNRVSDMCAQSINDFTPISPTISASFFNGSIPTDPLSISAVRGSSPYPALGCAYAVDGYIYETHYIHSFYMGGCIYPSPGTASVPPGTNSCSMAIQLGLKYLIIVALENPLPPGASAFKEFTTVDNNGPFSTERDGASNTLTVYNRSTYYLPGPYCGDSCYTD